MNDVPVCCPQCGSTQIAPVRKNYDMGCGCLGLLLFGWIGLLLGLLGGGDVEMVCANCGARWEPGRHKDGASSGCLPSLLLIIVILLLLAGLGVFGAERSTSTYRDGQGRMTGSSTTIGSGTTYRDGQGRMTGSSTTIGNSTTYRDGQGRMTGSSTTIGNNTTYRDASGRMTGSATTHGNVTTYRDASGKMTGSATKVGNQVIYRDASGRMTGSKTSR